MIGTKLLKSILKKIKSRGLEISPKLVKKVEIVSETIEDNDVLTIVNLKISERFGLWANHYKKSGKIAVLFGYDPSNPNARPLFI